MKSDIPERNDQKHEDKGDQDHHADHQVPVDHSINKGAKTDDDFKPDVEYTDSEFDEDDAFDSMIEIIRVAQWGGIEFSWLKSQRDRQLRPDEYATPAPRLMINEDGEACVISDSIPKQVPRQTFSPVNNEKPSYDAEESDDNDAEDFDMKQTLLVERLLPREFFAMETQAGRQLAAVVGLDPFADPQAHSTPVRRGGTGDHIEVLARVDDQCQPRAEIPASQLHMGMRTHVDEQLHPVEAVTPGRVISVHRHRRRPGRRIASMQFREQTPCVRVLLLTPAASGVRTTRHSGTSRRSLTGVHCTNAV